MGRRFLVYIENKGFLAYHVLVKGGYYLTDNIDEARYSDTVKHAEIEVWLAKERTEIDWCDVTILMEEENELYCVIKYLRKF